MTLLIILKGMRPQVMQSDMAWCATQGTAGSGY